MGRADYRGGIAPIRTTEQLMEILPIPLYLMVSGYAGPIFPRTDRSNPAPAVGIVGTRTIPGSLRPSMRGILPVWIHWTQWRDVVVPLLEDDRVTSWAGVLSDLGDLLKLAVPVRSPSGSVVYPVGTPVGNLAYSTKIPGGLYAPDHGDATSLIDQYRSLIGETSG